MCWRPCGKLLQSLPSHSFFLSSFHSPGHLFSRPSGATRCHHAAVTASAGAITGHTHHGKHMHTCIRTHTDALSAHTHTQTTACCHIPVGNGCQPALSWSGDWGLSGQPQLEIRWPFLDSVSDRQTNCRVAIVCPCVSLCDNRLTGFYISGINEFRSTL